MNSEEERKKEKENKGVKGAIFITDGLGGGTENLRL